jgi:hypothetical protein
MDGQDLVDLYAGELGSLGDMLVHPSAQIANYLGGSWSWPTFSQLPDPSEWSARPGSAEPIA